MPVHSDVSGAVPTAVVVEWARSQAETARRLNVEDFGQDAARVLDEGALEDARSSLESFRLWFQYHRQTSGETDVWSDPRLLSYFHDLWSSRRFISVMKWATAWPLANLAGVRDGEEWLFREHPRRPEDLPTGVSAWDVLNPVPGASVLRAWLRTRMTERTRDGSAPTRRALKLAWSLLGVKGMMPSMHPTEVIGQLLEHADLLSSSPPELSPLGREVLRNLTACLSDVCFGEKSRMVPVRYEDLPAARLSASAGFVKVFDEDNRKWVSCEGTRAAQLERLGGLTAARELTHMTYNPRTGKTTEHRQVPYQFHWSDWDYSNVVSVVALQEPFKIRTISIADGPSTAAGSRIQKAVHNGLRTLRPFQLIGGTTVPEALASVAWHPGVPFVSGDYSAATDRLSSEASRVVFDTLFSRLALPAELRWRLETSLFQARVCYTNTLDRFRASLPEIVWWDLAIRLPLSGILQKNGQLMGNILSFPILCVVNLAAYLVALLVHAGLDESLRQLDKDPSPGLPAYLRGLWRSVIEGRPFELQDVLDLEVLINGDDILFQAGPDLYEVWRQVIGSFGLKLSVGKNYYSSNFLTINSELYEVHDFGAGLPLSLSPVSRPWWPGLLPDFYRMRTQIKRNFGLDVLTCDGRLVLPRVQEKFLLSLDLKARDTLNVLWLRRMSSAGMMDGYRGLNWFIPIQYGGLGLDPSGWRSRDVTYAQKKLAVRLALHPDRSPKLGGDGSLPSDGVRRALLDAERQRRVTGPLLPVGHRTFVLDEEKPYVLRLDPRTGAPRLLRRAYETLDSYIQNHPIPLTWLDYHLTGVRLQVDQLQKRTNRLLRWGLEVNDQITDHMYPSLDGRSYHRVLSKPTLLVSGPSVDPALRFRIA